MIQFTTLGLEVCPLTGIVRRIDMTESNKAMQELREKYKRCTSEATGNEVEET